MAKGHWQIIDWTNDVELEGNTQTFEISDVPRNVIDVAIKATLLIGNGLYGVDIKEKDGNVYIIEINDNPNIDYGIEDAVWKEGLYRHIMQVIFDRIDMERNMIRYI
jgi:glutathione synthase/RimK-type ligase-like ATP-grasp enzyme